MSNPFRSRSTKARALLILSACGMIVAASLPAARAVTRAPPIPDTAAGHALGSWLDAFDSGDRGRIESFDNAHYPWARLEDMMAERARTGGYVLLSIDGGGKSWLIFHARERSGASQILGKLVVEARDPEVIWALSLAPAATDSTSVTLDTAERDHVLERLAGLLDQLYVIADVGRKMAAALRGAEERGTYQDITDGQILAWRLNADLQAIDQDEHLGVHFSPLVLPLEKPDRSPEVDAMARQRLLSSNCGFETVEHLDPNIGYLKFDEFDDPRTCAPIATAAMNFLSNSDALIIDMRDNHGGRGLSIISYLFAKPTHFMDTYIRRDHTIHEAWTSPHVPGRKFVGKPVFVLTSRRTFSNAEAFCYALKTLKRATLIGETTGGGAHPMEVHRIDDHFSISLPIGQSISPITHTDWEGAGVEPDIKVPATEALDEALRRARDLTREHPP